MEKILWILKNKVICFLLTLVPINILSVVLASVFIEETPTFWGIVCVFWFLILFVLNICFWISDFEMDKLTEYIVDYFRNWWAQKPE